MTKAATTLSISSDFLAGFHALLAPAADTVALSKNFGATSASPSNAKQSGQTMLFNVET